MFARKLEAVLADSEEARRLNYHLRYQVFCQETGFEDPANYPDEEEKDEFDAQSVHFLVQDTSSGDWIAAARLILPTGSPLPIQRHCNIAHANPPFSLGQTAEFSRLLMTKGYRQCRKNGKHPLAHGLNERGDRRIPASGERCGTLEVLRQLIQSMATYGREQGIPQGAFFVTAALARIIERLGIQLTAVGEPFEHRGRRIPYVVNSEQVYRALQGPTSSEGVAANVAPAYRRFSDLSSSSPGVQAHAAAGMP